MVSSNLVQLGEISEAIRGVTFSGGEAVPDAFENSLACLTTSGVQEVVNWDSRRFIPRDRLGNSKQLLQEGDILISTANSKELVGKSCIVDRLPYEATFGAFVTVVRPNKKVLPEFVAYWMKTKEFLDKCYLMSSNTTNISNLRTSELLEFHIPLPPLTEQKRIASLLARADRLRSLRRTARDLGDSLLQSVFLEMFGDVVRNDKSWKIMSLGQTCDEIYRYPTFYGFDYVEEGVPVVRIGDILLNGEVNPNLENYVCINPEINKRFPRTILELGDILMAVRGDGSTGKRIGMVKSKNLAGANISPNLLRFKANEKHVSSFYLFHFMTSSGGQELIDRYITRTAKKTITSTDIQTIRIPVPPLNLQEEFASVVARVEQKRARQAEGERQAEGLFEALLGEAFEQ